MGTLWYGKNGIKALALTNFQRAAYLKNQLSDLDNVQVITTDTCFNEFVVQFKQPLEKVLNHFHHLAIQPGVILEKDYSSLKNCLLVAVTETKSQDQLDRYIQAVRTIG